MTNCIAGEAKIIGRARAVDVTPETKGPRLNGESRCPLLSP